MGRKKIPRIINGRRVSEKVWKADRRPMTKAQYEKMKKARKGRR